MLTDMVLRLPPAESRIDIGVFVCALILAPIITGVALFFLVVPLFAIPVGAIPYLLFGTPAYWLTLRGLKNAGECTGPLVKAGLVANVGSVAFFGLFIGLQSNFQAFQGLAVMVVLGFVFAALWSMVFGWIYGTFAKNHLPHLDEEIFD